MSDVTWTPTTIPLRSLTPWERNPKRISKTHAARLLDLWERLGQFQTIAIGPAGEVYDGHQRLSVLKAAHGGKYEVQALQSSRALTEKEREELTVAAHVGTTGQFNWEDLSGWDAGDLQSWGFDTETLTNWQTDIGALRTMLDAEQAPTGDDPGAQVDKAAELQAKWGTATGQLWQLGEHRLICGDCTDREVVARVMGGEKAGMVFTDPPYGMNLDTDYTKMPNDLVKPRKYSSVIGDDKPFDFASFQWLECQEQFWWGADYYCQALPLGGSWFVWDKRVESNDASIGSGFELCWSKTPHKRRLLRYNWSGYTAHDPGETRNHPTQKPIALFGELLSEYSDPGSVVYDPFLGSGTTMVAAHRLGRRCFGIEVDPGYCAVTLERMSGLGVTPALVE